MKAQKLFTVVNTGSAKLLMITPVVFKGKEPTEAETEKFRQGLLSLLAEYLKAHGLSGSQEELNDLLEEKLIEGIVQVKQGLDRLGYYGIQHALAQREGLG